MEVGASSLLLRLELGLSFSGESLGGGLAAFWKANRFLGEAVLGFSLRRNCGGRQLSRFLRLTATCLLRDSLPCSPWWKFLLFCQRVEDRPLFVRLPLLFPPHLGRRTGFELNRLCSARPDAERLEKSYPCRVSSTWLLGRLATRLRELRGDLLDLSLDLLRESRLRGGAAGALHSRGGL